MTEWSDVLVLCLGMFAMLLMPVILFFSGLTAMMFWYVADKMYERYWEYRMIKLIENKKEWRVKK